MSYIKVAVDADASGYGPATVTEIGVEDANAYYLRPGETYWFDDCVELLAVGDRVHRGTLAVRKLPPEPS